MSYKLLNDKKEPRKVNGLFVVGSDHYSECKAVDLDTRTLTLVGTDETKDRDGDIITHGGWNFENFYKNPVFLWAHNYESVPLARTEKIVNRAKLKRHEFLMKFPTLGLNPFADMILALYNEKMINASSVGFIPYEWEEIKDDEGESQDNGSLSCWRCAPKRYLKKELLELSGCAVPCNPNAVAEFLEGKTFGGMRPADLVRAYTEGSMELEHKDDILEELRVNNFVVEDDRIMIPGTDLGKITATDGPPVAIPTAIDNYLNFLITDIEKGGNPISEEQIEENLRAADEQDKRVGGARNLPLADEGMAWDAAAAKQRARKWASRDGSGDKDTIDWAKFRKIFVWYDPADAENFGAYKLPFADIVGGSAKAVWRGVAAGMGALLGARGGVAIPDADRRPVYNFLSGYYRKFDKEPPEFRSLLTIEQAKKILIDQVTKIFMSGADQIVEEILYGDIVEMPKFDQQKLIEHKRGAVLSKRNLDLLRKAADNVKEVIDSATKEDEEDLLLEPEKGHIDVPEKEGTTEPIDGKGKAERADERTDSPASVYDIILEPSVGIRNGMADREKDEPKIPAVELEKLCNSLRELKETLERI